MNAFKRKSLYLAVAAGLGAVGVTGSAAAVTLSQTGAGQVLIYPYYTVRNATDTYISVANTTSSAKAVKVRFLEGKNSREVLDFNLYLSANDMWAGAIVATADGAKLLHSDNSCSGLPKTGAAPWSADFVNYAYGGVNTEYASGVIPDPVTDPTGDFEDKSLDRTREGYFEIIEMGVVDGTRYLQTAVTHVSGVPANCDYANAKTDGTDLLPPSGGLVGTASLMNVTAGTDTTMDPVALAGFSDAVIWFAPGSIHPDMTDVSPNTSHVYKNNTDITTNWALGRAGGLPGSDADAVSAVLMHDSIMNDYVLDAATLSGTDWVITMPTKRHYIPVDNNGTGTDYTAITPFTADFHAGGACETFSLQYWNREEGTPSTPAAMVSPLPPGAASSALCWESTVLTFASSKVLGSSNEVNQPIASGYENGWARIWFKQDANKMVDSTGAQTYFGLPAVGFMVQDFVNGNVGGVLSNYGGNFIHKYRTNIVAPGVVNPIGD